MNKNIMMAVLLMIGVGFGEMMVAYPLSCQPNLIHQDITFQNKEKNKSFDILYAIAGPSARNRTRRSLCIYSYPIYNESSNDSKYPALTLGSSQTNTFTLYKSDQFKEFELRVKLHSDKSNQDITVRKKYNFTDFNETGTYSIDTKGATIHVYDPLGKEIRGCPR
jgi:hypothetical protein